MTVQKQNRRARLRAFYAAWLITTLLLLLGMGFLIADYNTRLVGFGDSSLRMDISADNGQVKLDMFGNETIITISETTQKFAGFVWTVLSPGVRTAFWLYEGECEGATAGIEQISE